MPNADKKPFIPRDKPKSWVVLIIAILVGLLIGTPILFVSAIYDLSVLHSIGTTIFVGAWMTGVIMACVFVIGILRGKYGDIQDLPWSEQVW